MRILLITDNHTPGGGAEKYFFELKSRLQSQEKIEVFSLGFTPKASSGENFYTLPTPRSKAAVLVSRFFQNKAIKKALKSQINAFKPDVIHLHNIKIHTPSILASVKGFPVVQTIHDHSIVCPTAQNIHRDNTPCPTGIRPACLLKHRVKFNLPTYLILLLSFYKNRRLLKKTVNAFICPSPLLANYLKINQFNQVHHIALFREIKPSPPSFDKLNKRFLYAGQLAAHKGVDILIREFITAAQRDPSIHLDIVGSGPEEIHMKALVSTANLTNRIHFHGWKSDPSPYFKDAYAFLFPSIGLEGFPLVLMESLSAAKPVIGVKRGITEWLITPDIGLLFDPLSPGDLANKICMLANKPEAAQELGLRGHEKLEKLIDNEAALSQILATYHKTITAPK